MFSKYLILTLLLFFSYVHSTEFKSQYIRKVTPEDEARFFERLKQYSNITAPKLPPLPGRIELGRTWWDYSFNKVAGRTLAHALTTSDGQDGIHFIFSKVFPQGQERYSTYDYFDLGYIFFYGNQSVDETLGRSGWGSVVNGDDDAALIAFKSDLFGGIHLYSDVAEAAYTFWEDLTITSPIGAFYPAIDRVGNVVVFSGQLDYWPAGSDTFMVSRDYMQTWNGAHLAPGTPTQEIFPKINPANPQEISYAFLSGANNLIKTTTTNDGLTWDTLLVYSRGDSINNNYGIYALSEITQFNYIYSQNGIFHIVFCGYGLDADSNLVYPVIYWNDFNHQYIELTSEEKGHPQNPATQEGLINFRPGNGIGNAYPQLAEEPNGGHIAVIWQQWEDDGSGNILTVTPPGGNETFVTDIYGAYLYLFNGVYYKSFSEYIAGTPGISDVFPNLARTALFTIHGDSLLLDIMYFLDTEPGVSLFPNGNNPSEGIWYYQKSGFALPIPEGVNHSHSAKLGTFTLFENYPNPFNPVTKIKYGLKSTSPVKLEIYNVAGEKVATLVEGKVSPGEYEVTFNGADLPSGVYFYRLSSGDFSQTKKMILMR